MHSANYLQSIYVRAKEEKDRIQEKYNEATSLTFPSDNTYYDLGNISVIQNDHSKIIYDDISIEVSETLANQMELSLTKSGVEWAGFGVDDSLNNMEESSIAKEKTKEVFDYINNSNLQKNISYTYRDLIIGTSVLKIFVVNDGFRKKLAYKHLNLGRVFILENGLGDVDSVFYKIKDFTIEKIYSMLGKTEDYTSEEKSKYFEEDGMPTEFDIIEMAVPSKGKHGKWDFYIYDEGFGTCFFKKTLNYNPYVTVRFNKKNDVSPWGIGKAVERLALIKSIQFYSRTLMEVIANDSNPAYIVKSNSMDQPDFSFVPKSLSFVPADTDITPLFTNVDVQKLAMIIAELKAQLKQAFLIDSILEAQARNTYKTASEIQIANNKFLDKFATYASSISEELSKELFLRSYQLLVDEKMIKSLPKNIETKMVFTNPFTLGEKAKDVDKVVQLAQVVIGLIGQQQFASELKMENVVPFFVDAMDVPTSIFKTPEDKQAEQQQAQEQQQGEEMGQAMQQMGGMGQPSNGQGSMDSSNLGNNMFDAGGLGQ